MAVALACMHASCSGHLVCRGTTDAAHAAQAISLAPVLGLLAWWSQPISPPAACAVCVQVQPIRRCPSSDAAAGWDRPGPALPAARVTPALPAAAQGMWLIKPRCLVSRHTSCFVMCHGVTEQKCRPIWAVASTCTRYTCPSDASQGWYNPWCLMCHSACCFT